MGNLKVEKPGKSKQQLLGCLDSVKDKFKGDINDNDVIVNKTTEGYNFSAEKKILFMTFWVKADIIAREEEFELSWDTNAPESRVEDAIRQVKKVLEDC
jgi:hypothetical protein